MTVTVSVAKVPSAGADVNLDLFTLDKSKLSLIEASKDVSTGANTAQYLFDDGDPYVRKYVSVRFGATDKPTKNSDRVLYTRNQTLVESPILVTDDVSEIVTELPPLQVVITVNVPVGARPSPADLMKAVQEAFSLFVPSITSGAAATDHMSDLIQGNAKFLAG
jgi:hypothetical protein